jgi:benzoyl-CoA reductase subunit A
MRTFTGIDLGSTTTKAVMLDEDGQILGRGITNSRSNYDLAATIAKAEAHVSARFRLLSRELEKTEPAATLEKFLTLIEVEFRRQQSLEQLRLLADATARECEHPRVARIKDALIERVAALVEHMIQAEAKPAPLMVVKEEKKTSDFFRDRAASQYSRLAETHADARVTFDDLMSIFDKAIIRVENTELKESFQDLMLRALSKVSARFDETTAQRHRTAVQRALDIELLNGGVIGTGYGRQRLPFPKEDIRSEILCHGLGAHTMFPGTRTVLDIGGQDTKAIQVDDHGIVTSFQMNDRCAAGCGRYLGYIADEMNLGVHELGPWPCSRAPREDQLTCTVFAGAELRDRLSARGSVARTSWPACTAPSSCAPCRCWPARAACWTSSPSPAAWPRTAAVQALRQLVRRELRRAHA